MTLERRRRRANRSAWAREGGTDNATLVTIQSDDVRSCSEMRDARPYRPSRPQPTRRPGPRRSIMPAGAALAVEAVEAAGARLSPIGRHRGVGGLESGQPGDQPAGALAFRGWSANAPTEGDPHCLGQLPDWQALEREDVAGGPAGSY